MMLIRQASLLVLTNVLVLTARPFQMVTELKVGASRRGCKYPSWGQD